MLVNSTIGAIARGKSFWVKLVLGSIGLMPLILSARITSAQSNPPVRSDGATPNLDNLNSESLNEPKIIQQPLLLDPNSDSRQFFQQGREQLYFLPKKSTEPILEIDEEIEEQIESDRQ